MRCKECGTIIPECEIYTDFYYCHYCKETNPEKGKFIDKLKCEICFKEYKQEIIFSYKLNKIACIPCIKMHCQPDHL